MSLSADLEVSYMYVSVVIFCYFLLKRGGMKLYGDDNNDVDIMVIRTNAEPIIIMTGTIDAVLYCHDGSDKSGLCLTSFSNSLVTFCTISG